MAKPTEWESAIINAITQVKKDPKGYGIVVLKFEWLNDTIEVETWAHGVVQPVILWQAVSRMIALWEVEGFASI